MHPGGAAADHGPEACGGVAEDSHGVARELELRRKAHGL